MPSTSRTLFPLTISVALLCAAPLVRAATFTWANATGNWSVPASWAGAAAPSGLGTLDELEFGGVIAPDLAPAASPTAYTATNDFATGCVVNRLTLTAVETYIGAKVGIPHQVTGNAVRFAGSSMSVTQNGAGAIVFSTPVEMSGDLTLGGSGLGVVTFNRGFKGVGDITKDGTSVFRFGTFPPPIVPPATTSTAPSENQWIGALRLNNGIVRFNNNADSGRTAIRANPVVFPPTASSMPTLTCSSALRTGTLSGILGKVEAAVTAANQDSVDLVLTAIPDGSFAGTVRVAPPSGTGNDVGQLVIRGPGRQTFTGTMEVDKDIELGGTMVLAETATLGAQTKGSVLLSGGRLILDNTTTNNTDRLRNGNSTSTGLDNVGGGLVQLIGHTAGTSETISRIQLGAQTGASAPFKTKARAGELQLNLVHRAGATAATVLTAQTYERDASSEQPLNTVNFSAVDGAGTTLNLGTAGSNPRISFTALPIALSNSLLTNSTGTSSTGWATVQTTGGLAFATHGTNGIAAATTVTTWASSTTANVLLAGTQSIGATAFSLNSLRIAPSAASQSLTIASGGTLATKGIILSGATDYTIGGAGALAGTTPRYIHVEKAALTLDAAVGNTAAIVKAGAGTLVLTNTANTTSQQIVALNRGALRTGLTSLPGGELRFRGGVLEITGGGTFSRPLLTGAVGSEISGPGTVNWNTIELAGTTPTPTKTASDRGSGGFAAVGQNVSVDLDAAGPTVITWEQKGFVQSGYALVFGSANATAAVSMVDTINLTSGDATINYNAREFRVDDNPASTTDRAILAGGVSGTLYNDLLKTGAGVLELAGTSTFAGMAVVQNGTLVISGTASGAMGVQVMNGATLSGGGSTTNILLENGGKVSPGDSNSATLTATGLVWKAGGVCRFDLGGDQLSLGTGGLVKNGAGTFAFDFGDTGAANQVYTLATFGSTTFAAGDFTAVNAGASGTFKVIGNTLVFDTNPPLTAIQQWRQTHFGTIADSGSAADLYDADFDGIVNIHEYALGTVPTSAAASPIGVSHPANHLVFTFPRNAAATDVSFAVEAKDDLTTGLWTPIATSTTPGVWNAVGTAVAGETGGIVTVTDSADILTAPKRFLRLSITRLP